jgi:hypothetical protein
VVAGVRSTPSAIEISARPLPRQNVAFDSVEAVSVRPAKKRLISNEMRLPVRPSDSLVSPSALAR